MQHIQIDRRRFLAGLGASTGLAFAGCAVPGGVSLSSAAPVAASAWPNVEAFVPAFVAQYPIPGVVVALGRGQEAPRYFADGVTENGGSVSVDANTLWRIYSMTKPVTGMATMLLIEDGQLSLNQNVADILPEFADPRVLTDPANSLDSRAAAGPITIRHLLTHTAGLGYTIVTRGPLLAEYERLGIVGGLIGTVPIPGFNPPPGFENMPANLAEFSERLGTLPLIAEPGAKWSYSVSIDLLGRVIEVASGMPFETFLQERIFTPLGMNDTFFQVPASKVGQMTTNYGIRDGVATMIDPANNSVFSQPPPFPMGGAGLVSSAHDYDRFLTMLLGEGAIGGARIMSTETARLAMSDMLYPGVDKSAMYDPSGFGAGGRVTIEDGILGGQGIGSYGWGGAAGTVAWVDRVNNLRTSGFVQNFPGEATPFRQGVAQAAYADLAS